MATRTSSWRPYTKSGLSQFSKQPSVTPTKAPVTHYLPLLAYSQYSNSLLRALLMTSCSSRPEMKERCLLGFTLSAVAAPYSMPSGLRSRKAPRNHWWVLVKVLLSPRRGPTTFISLFCCRSSRPMVSCYQLTLKSYKRVRKLYTTCALRSQCRT